VGDGSIDLSPVLNILEESLRIPDDEPSIEADI
jgi:hypothetical protein